jgi:hypothetical protein
MSDDMNRTPIEQIANKVKNGEALSDTERETVFRIVMIVGQHYYEKTGAMFISGFSGDVECDGLPKYLFVCPAFGSDITGLYAKQEGKSA